jgi:hypothetical protein
LRQSAGVLPNTPVITNTATMPISGGGSSHDRLSQNPAQCPLYFAASHQRLIATPSSFSSVRNAVSKRK